MLQGEMPFGSWRESELDTFAKIAKGQLSIPQTFSPEVVDLITKVLHESFNHFSVPPFLIRIFHMLTFNFNNMFSYLTLMKTQDWEAKVMILSKGIPGLTVLIGKGSETVVFLFLMRSLLV